MRALFVFSHCTGESGQALLGFGGALGLDTMSLIPVGSETQIPKGEDPKTLSLDPENPKARNPGSQHSKPQSLGLRIPETQNPKLCRPYVGSSLN